MQNTKLASKEKVETSQFGMLASQESVTRTKAALEKNGFKVILAKNGREAKEKALELIPKGAEVFTMTSVTNNTIGLAKEIDESGNYDSVRLKMSDDELTPREKKRLGAAPEYAIGSVHAITEDGHVFVASNTGSQLSAYAYGSDHVIWVAGTQKIVANQEEARKRIYEHILPLESVRLNKQYNMDKGSFVSKLLIFSREFFQDRITIILVDEALGF